MRSLHEHRATVLHIQWVLQACTHRTAVRGSPGQRRKLSSVCDFNRTLVYLWLTVLIGHATCDKTLCCLVNFFFFCNRNITGGLDSGWPQPEINALPPQGEETFDWVFWWHQMWRRRALLSLSVLFQVAPGNFTTGGPARVFPGGINAMWHHPSE